MATTMDSTQVSISAAEEVEMMLVENAEDDNGEEIKIDDELDDEMDDEDDLTDDDDDDVVSTSGHSHGRRTPNHHHHHHHGHFEQPRVQQHHHHHFHYFYQYPANNATNPLTVNNSNVEHLSSQSDNNSQIDNNNQLVTPMNDAGSAGLVRTISNGSMFGPINANLVPALLHHPSRSFPVNNLINNYNNNHHAHVYNNNSHPVPPTIYEGIPTSASHQYQHNIEQTTNPLVQQIQQQQQQQHHPQSLPSAGFRPKLPTIVQSPSSLTSSPTTLSPSSSPSSSSISFSPASMAASTSGSEMQPASSQTTVISSSASSSSSSPVGCTSTNINNNNVNIVNINNNTTYQSPPASPSSSHSVEESKNQQQANSQQQQHVQNQQQQQVQQQPPQQQTQQPQQQQSQQQTPLVSTASPVSSLPTIVLPYTFGRSYQLTSQIEASNLYLCVDTVSQQEFCCKVVNSSKYSKFLGPHMRMDGHEGINQIQKVIFEQHFTFVLFERSFGDLHSYVRNKRRLRENEAQTLFQQILQIVADCHHNGIVLRDLKLRKFIFANEEKTKLKLETLEGASIFEGDNDILTDKHGCPAYVSPEILYSNSYSGMAADCWSMGVILYTMLVGRYPFHDLNPSIVFVKIRRGTYDIPETLSKQARCLIRNLIRLEPEHRLTANDALAHRWFQEKWNLNTKERIIQQHISNLHSFQHQQFLFQHSLSDLTLGPPPRAILTPSLIEGLLQLSDDQVVPTF